MLHRNIALLLLHVRQRGTIGIHKFNVAATYSGFGMCIHERSLRCDTSRQHDVIGAKRYDQAAFRASDGLIQGATQPFVLLRMKIKPKFSLQTSNAFNAVVAGAVIDHEQIQVRIVLSQYAADGRFDILCVII